jgi:ubiquinone biosynthesis protein
MRISTLPHLYRNAKRSGEIVAILVKYGFADWVSRLQIEFPKDLVKDADGAAVARFSFATRVRLALTEGGPTFIKLGQVLSTRADLVGVEVANELQKLQADVPADPPEVVRAIVEAELGQPIDEIYDDFDDVPLASASIGQVHRARLKTGEFVVVKVQHANIEPKVDVDLEILANLAAAAESFFPELRNYRPKAVVAEFQRTLRRELDFGREERHMEEFAKNFRDNATVHIPKAYPEYTTVRVLTMELLEGVKLADTERLIADRTDLEEIARRGAELYMEMIFTHGFYHADPHPGNILVLKGQVIGLLDFGMVGRIDEALREDIEEMLMALGNRDPLLLTSVIMRVGSVPANLDTTALSADLNDFVSHYAGQRMSDFNLSGALDEMTEIIRRYKIMLPPRVAMLFKVLVMLEGTSRLLQPSFSLIEVMAPFQRKMIIKRWSPGRRLRKFRRIYSELEHLVEVLPRNLLDIMQQVQSGKFDVHLDHRGLEPSVNRLVLGMLTSALFLGSSLLLSYKVPPLISIFPWQEAPYIAGLSILGLLGSFTSIGLGLRLIRAINKSGHLDRRRP